MKGSDLRGPAIALAPLLILLVLVGLKTDWQFVYTLDDPYIHLALRKGLVASTTESIRQSFRLLPAASCGHS